MFRVILFRGNEMPDVVPEIMARHMDSKLTLFRVGPADVAAGASVKGVAAVARHPFEVLIPVPAACAAVGNVHNVIAPEEFKVFPFREDGSEFPVRTRPDQIRVVFDQGVDSVHGSLAFDAVDIQFVSVAFDGKTVGA